MKNKSIWLDTVSSETRSAIAKDMECDVLIIGGGLVGLSCAYYLANSKKKVVLVDKDCCGKGVSAGSTAKITWMQGIIYSQLQKNFDEKMAFKYYCSQIEAMKNIINIIEDKKIDCELEKANSYIFTNKLEDFKKLKEEEKFYQNNRIKYSKKKDLPLKNYPCKYALEGTDSYVFNPVKYMEGLKKLVLDSGIQIFENTVAYRIDKKIKHYITYCNKYKVKSKKVIVCTNYPLIIEPGLIPFKITVEKSYVIGSKFKENGKFSAISTSKPIQSIRFANVNKNNYILYGGNSHKITTSINSGLRYGEHTLQFRNHFDNSIDYFWVNQDVMTTDGLPYAGIVDNNGLMVITGFNKWGMTNSNITAKVVTDIILDKDNEYIDLFSWDRKFSKDKFLNILGYNTLTGIIYIAGKFKNNYKFYNNRVKIEYRNKHKVGIYIDDEGKYHVVSNICPHFKCNLIFNNMDKTWDCPCHGSRFDIDGKVILGPATADISIKEKNKD